MFTTKGVSLHLNLKLKVNHHSCLLMDCGIRFIWYYVVWPVRAQEVRKSILKSEDNKEKPSQEQAATLQIIWMIFKDLK